MSFLIFVKKIKEILLSLDISCQKVMTIHGDLYHRYIEIISNQIENYGEVSKIKSNITIHGKNMKQPPRQTIRDVLLQFIKEQKEFNAQIIERIVVLEIIVKQQGELLQKVIKLNNLKI